MTTELLASIDAADEAKKSAWSALLASYCGKELLPGITRRQFESALKTGFDCGWDAKELNSPLSHPYASIAGTESQ